MAAAISLPTFSLVNIQNGTTRVHPRQQSRPLSRRMLLEALILTVLSVLVFGFIFQKEHESLALGAAGITSFGIDVGSNPTQKAAQQFSQELPVYNGLATITGDAAYSISAKVESKKEYDDVMSGAVPFDLLLAWGDMATTPVDSKFSWEQAGREGLISGTLGGSDGAEVDKAYVTDHVSNNHVIPANDRIMAALRSIQPGDVVKIDGRLVDVRLRTNDNRGLVMKTSKSRLDEGDGACEIIFVEHIKVNEKSYR